MADENTPEMIEDAQLDDASGGLLVPAIQKIREPAATSSAARMQSANNLKQMGVGVTGDKEADGSV